jgi:hypothetical protein
MNSFVAMEKKACPVCGQTFDSGAVLINTRLRDIKEPAITGWEFCPDHQKLKDDGFIALVEIDENKSRRPFTPDSVWRTGRIAYVRNEVAAEIFNVPLSDKGLAFVDANVIDKLAAIYERDVGEPVPTIQPGS